MLEDHANRAEVPWPQFAADQRRAFLLNRLSDWEAPDGKNYPAHSLRYRLLEELTKDAVLKVSATSQCREADLQNALLDAEELVNGLWDAATSFEADRNRREFLNFWRHADNPALVIKNKAYKLPVRSEVEGIASHYLKQSLRSQMFDRTLADMLLAQELYQFADEMIHPVTFPGLPSASSLKQSHPLWRFVRENLIVTILFAAIGFAAAFGMRNGIVGDWAGWIVGACFALWFINIAWSFLVLPFVWMKWSKDRKKVLQLLEVMGATYALMHSDAVISANHVLESVKASSASGVVWPSPIYVLLEDVISRGGRF